MKIDPTKMIDNEIQWLLNFECGTNLGKVLPSNGSQVDLFQVHQHKM